jgi:hypothetical protein
MTKSRPRRATKTKSSGHKSGNVKKGKKRVLTNPVIVGTITVTAEGVLTVDPYTISTFPGGPAIWLVNNLHANPHIVSIDPGKIKEKGSGKPLNPFPSTGALKSQNLQTNEWGAIVATTDMAAAKVRYKYTIEATGGITELDPDLDVANPPSILL